MGLADEWVTEYVANTSCTIFLSFDRGWAETTTIEGEGLSAPSSVGT